MWLFYFPFVAGACIVDLLRNNIMVRVSSCTKKKEKKKLRSFKVNPHKLSFKKKSCFQLLPYSHGATTAGSFASLISQTFYAGCLSWCNPKEKKGKLRQTHGFSPFFVPPFTSDLLPLTWKFISASHVDSSPSNTPFRWVILCSWFTSLSLILYKHCYVFGD